MAVAANADDYAAARLNWFFKGVDPTLDGQCVSLVKWFLQEMTSVSDPQAARGDARYMGHTLVDQGYAIEVPYSDRRRGDVITYEYGTYGHIGVVLSGDRTFEENVNWPGVASKVVDGATVFASRIGSLSESWRHDQHIYRIKSYNEGGTMDNFNSGDAANIGNGFFGQSIDQVNQQATGTIPFKTAIYNILASGVIDDTLKANKGDITNVCTALGIPFDQKLVGIPFKALLYNVILPHVAGLAGDVKPYDGPALFVKK